jgi:hypothetical protein
MMKDTLQLMVTCLSAAALAGCIGFERQSTVTGPSAAGISALMGNLTSSNIVPSPTACTDFTWTVSEQTPTSARGAVSASCPGDLKLIGTAQGTLNGSFITWSAEGTGSAPGLTSCAITLSGSAEIGLDSIRVPYSGTTCLGPVSGTEILRRK